jgi:multimeric flavodoxin WrbA
MKILIIYYSYHGNTKRVAEILDECLKQTYEVRILRLETLNESTSFFRQAARAFFHKKARLSFADFDLSGYDLICLGTPVWAFAPTPAINAYLDGCFGLEGKSVVLFTTYGSGAGVIQCLNYMQTILSNKGAKDFKRFSIHQFRINDKEFVSKVISEALGKLSS